MNARKCLITSVMALGLACSSSHAGCPSNVLLQLYLLDDRVIVLIENTGDQTVTIASNFEIGGQISLSPLYLVARDKEKNERKFTGVIDSIVMPGKVDVAPLHVYGRIFPLSAVRRYLAGKSGSFDIKAIYDDSILASFQRLGAEGECPKFESGWLTIDAD